VSDGALAGVRVVEFGQYIAGPLAGMLLADQGADVIHVDPPEGPRWDTSANAVWHRGKRRLVLDLRAHEDVAVGRRLMAAADVVVENFRPSVMDRLGLGAESSMAANPGLVYCSMPGFAADDPRGDLPGWEGVVSAAGGAYCPIDRSGDTLGAAGQGQPVFSAVPIASGFAALLAVTGIVAALAARRRLGIGQRIEVPLFDAMFVALGHRASRLPSGASAATADTIGIRLLGFYPCADHRWIYFHTFNKRTAAYLEAIGAGSWMTATDARARLEDLFSSRPALAWEDLGAEIGAEVVMVRTGDEWLHERHAREGGLVEQVDDPRYGSMLQPGVAVGMSSTPGAVRFPSRPPDADRERVLEDLEDVARYPTTASAHRDRSESRPSTAPASAGALAGLKVLDLAIVLAGPTCGRTLAELGAEVTKVEIPPDRASTGLGTPPATSPMRMSVDVNRGKYSIVLDLRLERDRDTLWSLIDDVDVFVENFRGGVIDRLGFGYDAVRRRRPDLVYASLNTYGYRGPWRDRPGHEQLAQSVSGMAERYGGDGPPELQNVGALDDYGTGVMGAYAVILGLLHRDSTGEGQRVTTSLAATASTLQSVYLHDYAGKRWDEPRGRALGYGPLQRLYRTADGTSLFLAVGPDQKDRLADVPGLEGIDLRSFTDPTSALATLLAEEPSDVWVERLRASGIGAHQAVSVGELLDDPWVRAHGLVTERLHDGIGMVAHAGPAIRMSHTPVRVGRPAPRPDADREAVLGHLRRTT
jgi:crotonobetainyl-CoA:carnitine CoA-transferase CaiB-like acyl-CoA transferase